ncbi:MAG: ester cyclase [Chloroflexota bacterium]|nr:ester cyclase [Chloroflexota bacterium]
MNDKVRAIVHQLTDYMNRHDAEAASKLFAENVLFWEPSYDEPRHGRTAVRRELEGFFAMLPDIEFTPLTLFIDGDHLVHEWRYQATYQGRPIELRECAVVRLNAEDLFAEVRIYFDRLSLLRQLGLMQEE